jgi:hypothetical protein
MIQFENDIVGSFIKKSIASRPAFRICLVVFALILSFLVTGLYPGYSQLASAQATEEVWDEPVNLSRSGGTTNPQLVIDTIGKIHVIWEDRFDGYFYTYHYEEEWSSPDNIELPFDTLHSALLPDFSGNIHAFWIDEDDRLLHKKISGDSFAVEESWEAPVQVGASAVDLSVVIDQQGVLHTAYVRPLHTTSSPAGVYYKYSNDGGVTWSAVELLYSSSYLRGVNSETTSISISSSITDTGTSVYVVWDNRSRRQVFLAHSMDGGITWSDPLEIDRPGSEFGASRPFNIQVSAIGENVLLIWQNGIPEMSCSQYYMWSNNAGETWSARLPLPAALSGCPQETDLKFIKENITLLLTGGQWVGYIQAWNGIEWSDSSGQPLLSTFEDPEIFESIALQCRQFAYHPIYDRLFVVGCDTTGGGDIWISSRLVGDVDHWYPLPPVWSHPETIVSGEGHVSSLVMAAGSDDKVHITWIETLPGNSTLNPSAEIYYSRIDGSDWTRPSAIPGLPGANPGSTSIALDSAGRLMMVWSDNSSGKIYFEWASATQANSPSSWTSPSELPTNSTAARSPQILVENDGIIYVSYAVPLNEGRGIYLTWSSDRGDSWSSPVRIFDAETAGWEMVDHPRLAFDEDGSLHAVFTRYSLPGGRGPLGLYYARSTDMGETWTRGELVAEKPVLWSQIVSAGDRGLHRAWMEVDAGRRLILHQYSLDGGATWTRSEIVSNYAVDGGSPELTVDSANRLHLLQAARDIVGDLILYHWQWDGVFWYANDNLSLQAFGDIAVTGFYSAVSGSGKISAGLSTGQMDGNSTVPTNSILITSRRIEVPETALQPVPTPSAQPAPTPPPTQAPLPILTPTVDLSVYENYNMLPVTSGPVNRGMSGLIIGGSLATLLVGLVFVVGIRKAKGKR